MTETILVSVKETETILVGEEETELVLVTELIQGMAGATGAKGDPGVGGGAINVSGVAGADLGGHRFVVASAGGWMYADNATVANAGLVLGVTTGAIVNGASGYITTEGEITNTGWAFDIAKNIFLGSTGLVTQTPPSTGVLTVVGVPIDATTMYVRILKSILLN